jgi:hypothetical protein
MPDLSGLKRDSRFEWFAASLFADAPPLIRLYMANLTRLTDRVVQEYEAARQALDLHASAETSLPDDPFFNAAKGLPVPALGAMLNAVDHLESCFDCVRRGVLMIEAIVEDPSTRIRKRAVLPGNVDWRVLKDFRDLIQHADERMRDAKPPEPAFLVPLNDAVYFADIELPYAVLARAIEQIHAVTREWLGFE